MSLILPSKPQNQLLHLLIDNHYYPLQEEESLSRIAQTFPFDSTLKAQKTFIFQLALSSIEKESNSPIPQKIATGTTLNEESEVPDSLYHLHSSTKMSMCYYLKQRLFHHIQLRRCHF